jgi:hypothetical protein
MPEPPPQFPTPPPSPPRSVGMWMKLLFVYTGGLVMWAIYLVAIGYVLLRVFF